MKPEWERCRPWIEAALEGSGWTFEEIAAGPFYLFAHPEGCMVAEIIQSPRSRVFHVFAAGGTMRAVEDLLPQVEDAARRLGCDCGGATGRRGWVRVLAKYGYRPAHSAVEKEL